MTGLRFFKMTGSGNDFVFLDGRSAPEEASSVASIRALCDRRTGVGADGLVVITPEGDGAVRMVYFNADGSRAGMCGNAALCSTRLADRLGMASGTGMRLVTDTGVLDTRCVGPGWSAELRLVDFELPKPMPLPLLPGERWMALVQVGVPHVVLLVDDISRVDVVGRGGGLRRDPAFAPAGTNVNFIGRVPAEGPGAAEWRLRTYERGVEAETLACGTGTVGAAFALAGQEVAKLPLRIGSWGGNVYSVAGSLESGMARSPWLCGEGRLVFEGLLAGLPSGSAQSV